MNVNVRATQVGLYKGLEGVDVSAALTRDTAAQMVWNALQAMEVGYEYTLVSENGQLVSKTELVPKATTLLESKYEGKIVEGTLSQFSYNTNKEEWTYEIAVSTSDTVQVKSTQDFTALMGQIVKLSMTTIPPAKSRTPMASLRRTVKLSSRPVLATCPR